MRRSDFVLVSEGALKRFIFWSRSTNREVSMCERPRCLSMLWCGLMWNVVEGYKNAAMMDESRFQYLSFRMRQTHVCAVEKRKEHVYDGVVQKKQESCRQIVMFDITLFWCIMLFASWPQEVNLIWFDVSDFWGSKHISFNYFLFYTGNVPQSLLEFMIVNIKEVYILYLHLTRVLLNGVIVNNGPSVKAYNTKIEQERTY